MKKRIQRSQKQTTSHGFPLLGLIRIFMGSIFLWAFLDKTFGLGFATAPDTAWILGGSPTYGFLMFGTKGPFTALFQALAGSAIVDWIFMLGLLGIGIGLLFGILMNLATYGGVIILLLMYVAGYLPPEHHPILDDHIIYALFLIALNLFNAENYLGFGNRWAQTSWAQNSWFCR